MQYYLLQMTFGEKVQSFIENDLMFFIRNLLIALVIFYVGKWVANKLADLSAKLMTASKMDETLVKFMRTLVYIGLMVVVAIAAIGRLGVETTSFAAILAAAGLAVGMALKDTLGNFASGVMIIMFSQV